MISDTPPRNLGGEFATPKIYLVDVSDIFYFSSAGEGKGESRATGRGEGGRFFLLKIPGEGGGGGCSARGGGEGYREGVCREFGGGGR